MLEFNGLLKFSRLSLFLYFFFFFVPVGTGIPKSWTHCSVTIYNQRVYGDKWCPSQRKPMGAVQVSKECIWRDLYMYSLAWVPVVHGGCGGAVWGGLTAGCARPHPAPPPAATQTSLKHTHHNGRYNLCWYPETYTTHTHHNSHHNLCWYPEIYNTPSQELGWELRTQSSTRWSMTVSPDLFPYADYVWL